jgi:hypothetical protein
MTKLKLSKHKNTKTNTKTKSKSKTNTKTKSNINKKNRSINKHKGGGTNNPEDYIYNSQYISTQQNQDINYKEVGIVHITESAAINALKGFATGVANIFGSKGFDNSVYDKARNSALNKIMKQINTQTQKICNLRMDVENNPTSSLFFIHIYGTLLEKKK